MLIDPLLQLSSSFAHTLHFPTLSTCQPIYDVLFCTHRVMSSLYGTNPAVCFTGWSLARHVSLQLAVHKYILQVATASVGRHWFFSKHLLHPLWLVQNANVSAKYLRTIKQTLWTCQYQWHPPRFVLLLILQKLLPWNSVYFAYLVFFMFPRITSFSELSLHFLPPSLGIFLILA